jgi:lysophospholipase L1-like esterase
VIKVTINKGTASRGAGCLVLALLLNSPAGAAQSAASYETTRPIEDPSGRAMLGFYQSLERAYQGEWVTRILHYGDSHVAADILTGSVRRQLQSCFGNGGAGFVLPGTPYSRAGVTCRTSPGWRVEGLTQASVASDARLGLGGASISAQESGEWITVTAVGSYFDIYLLKQPGGGVIDVILDGVMRKRNFSLASLSSEFAYIEIVADSDSVHTIEIRTASTGRTRLFGLVIERNSTGVVYDALGINGTRASRPLQWDWKVLSASIRRRDPDLIVVAYGSNEVSDLDLDLEEYATRYATLLRRFHDAAPRASILVIAPPDRAVRDGNKWRTVSAMPALVEAQRRAAFSSGAAFYDLFNAMGGAGSIARWATLREPLAQSDRVHLTSAGYRLVADWLYAELMNGLVDSPDAKVRERLLRRESRNL